MTHILVIVFGGNKSFEPVFRLLEKSFEGIVKEKEHVYMLTLYCQM